MEPDAVLERAVALVARYAEQAPLSVWYAKKAVNTGMQLAMADALKFERELTTVLWTTEDRIEGMSAFWKSASAVQGAVKMSTYRRRSLRRHQWCRPRYDQPSGPHERVAPKQLRRAHRRTGSGRLG